MEVTINTVSDCDHEIEITLTQEELAPHFEAALKKTARTVEIPGFRRGHVPPSMVRRMYGDSIEQDAIDDIANSTFRKVIEERKIQPLGTPAMVEMKYKPGEPLWFKIKYEIKPQFALKDYKGIKIEQFVHPVKDKEVNAEIDRLRHANAAFEPAQKVDGTDYTVTADLQELDEGGAPLIGKKNDGMRFYLAEPGTEKEIKEALKAAEAGGVYKASFHHQHGEHAHPVHLQITVKKIEKVILPAFDDDFVRKITGGKADSAAAFRSQIRTDLERYWKGRSEKKLMDDLTNEIVRRHEFSVPESLVSTFLDSYIEDIKNQQRTKQLPRGFDEQKYRDAARPSAVWQARWFLVREQLLAAEKIAVTDAEIEALAEEESKRLNIAKERLVEFYKTSDAATDRIVNDKLAAVLKNYSSIKEVLTDEAGALA